MPVDRRIERQLRKLEKRAAQTSRKQPLSVERIVQTALDIVAAEGFEALTMRRVAATLDTGPASLYAHVVNKADLDELLIGYLCSRIVLPEPDPDDVARADLRPRGADPRPVPALPGISQAALGVVPSNPEALRLSEGMLGILLAGGVPAQTAAWAIDALSLYVNATASRSGCGCGRWTPTAGGWSPTTR